MSHRSPLAAAMLTNESLFHFSDLSECFPLISKYRPQMSDKQKISPFNLSLAPMESSLGYVRLDVIIAHARTCPWKHTRTHV